MKQMKHKVLITAYSDLWWWVSIQKNENGKFWTPEKLFISSEHTKGLEPNQVLEFIDNLVNNEATMPYPQRSYPISDWPRTEEIPESEDQVINDEDIEAKIERIKLRFQENKRVLAISFVVFLIGILWITIYSSGTSVQNPWDSIWVMRKEIDVLRDEREKVYDDCLAVCEADRWIYDAQVNIRKNKIIKEQISLNKWPTFLQSLFQ